MMRALSATLRSSAVTTIGSTAALLGLGHRDARTPWAPLDAVSHIAWGDRAYAYDELDAKHTLVGALLNAGAMVMWSAVHELLSPRRPTLARALATGAAVSALAYVVDYHVVPKRFTPGFEHKLPRRGLRDMYIALALSLAAGGWFARQFAHARPRSRGLARLLDFDQARRAARRLLSRRK